MCFVSDAITNHRGAHVYGSAVGTKSRGLAGEERVENMGLGGGYHIITSLP